MLYTAGSVLGMFHCKSVRYVRVNCTYIEKDVLFLDSDILNLQDCVMYKVRTDTSMDHISIHQYN